MKAHLALTFCLSLCITLSAAAQTFTATRLAAGDGSTFYPSDLNNQAQVIGRLPIAGTATSHAVLWQNGVLKDLGASQPDAYSWADAINDRGAIVGGIASAPAMWQDGVLLSQAPPPNPVDINNAGQVVGGLTTWFGPGNTYHVTDAYLWKDGTKTTLDQLPDGETLPVAIDNNGKVLGSVHVLVQSSDRRQALLWNGTTPVTLDPAFYDPTDMNDRGEVLGLTLSSESAIWKDGSITPLPLPSGILTAAGEHINNRGQVTGSAYDTSYQRHAVLWDAGGLKVLDNRVKDLPKPLYDALALNDRGQILASASNDSYLLTPIYGDANGDFTVDAGDVTDVLRAASGLGTVACSWICDVAPSPSAYPGGFGNGSVDIADAVRIMRNVARVDPALP